MKKSFIILLHIGFWFLFLMMMTGLAFVGQGTDDPPNDYGYYFELLVGFVLIPSLISFYTFYNWLFPNYVQQQKWWKSIFYGFLISFGGAAAGLFYLTNFTTYSDNSIYEKCVQEGMLFTSIIAFICGFVAVVIRGFLTWLKEIKIKAALLQKNHEMEMALVKAQLDPHFLFNTINNIDVLILKNATEASNYLNKLSDIMRFMLFETKPKEIPLSKEVEYIEKYIALQKIRTANDNYVNFSVKGNSDKKTIAPMVFIPFIENAFKHSSNKKLDNAININIQIEEESVHLACENKFDDHRKIKNGSNGLGNDLIKKRLDLIYPNRHILEVKNQNDLYAVNLTINHAETPMHHH